MGWLLRWQAQPLPPTGGKKLTGTQLKCIFDEIKYIPWSVKEAENLEIILKHTGIFPFCLWLAMCSFHLDSFVPVHQGHWAGTVNFQMKILD
jgi:hypothetical protein